MSRFRESEITDIKNVSSIFGLPEKDFDQMSDLEVAAEWMTVYESYPIFFGEEIA